MEPIDPVSGIHAPPTVSKKKKLQLLFCVLPRSYYDKYRFCLFVLLSAIFHSNQLATMLIRRKLFFSKNA